MHPSLYAKTTSDKPAIIMGQSGNVITFSELDKRSNRLAHLFRQLGLQRGDCIAFMIENQPLLLELCFAADRSGLYFVPVSTRLKPEELAYIVSNSDAKLFFTTAVLGETAASSIALLPAHTRRFIAGGALPGYESLEDALLQQPDSPLTDQSIGSAFFYSSGSTGRPKGVRRALPNEPFCSMSLSESQMKDVYGFNQDMVYLSPAPLYHAAPLAFSMSTINFGGTLVVMEKFDAEASLALIERFQVTHSQWVPTMFARLVKLPEEIKRKYDTSSLRLAIHAAAPCPPEIKRQMINWWGDAIVEFYSGTEGGGFCFVTAKEWLQRPGTVGQAKGCEIHVCDDANNDLPAGQIGLIYFGAGQKFVYYKDPEKTNGAHHPMGWSTLGDMGYLDEEGYLFLSDRKDFMIISGGVNIYPAETENILINHPAVTDVAVIGVPSEEFGEAVKAIIQPADWSVRGPVLEEELIRYCRERLADIKCPRSIDFVQELPRLPTGKLQKKLIRQAYWEVQASPPAG